MIPLDIPPALEAWAEAARPYAFRDEAILGTRMNLVLVARSFAEARAAALAARAEIDRLAAILDDRRPSSELSRLNGAEAHAASPELFAVVQAAERWRGLSGGAYSGRLGRVIGLWAQGLPERARAAELAGGAAEARVELEPATRTIVRPPAVTFALDGLAKGWIVDRAVEAARRQPGVAGALVDIGGDIRCGGAAPEAAGWRVGVADPNLPFDNAPLVAELRLDGRAVATSGRGPRDREIGGRRYSPTLSPFDGWPVEGTLSATAVADAAADADALATALLVLPRERAVALAAELSAPARIVGAAGQIHAAPAFERPPLIRAAATASAWPASWQALATFTAPRRQLVRDPDFRSPYMAMWITDMANRPIRTLILVGKSPEWQRDNFIWWRLNRGSTGRLVSTRSMSTSGAGIYNVFWDGLDDANRPAPAGTYILHVETSRERGKHTYRSLTLDFSTGRRFRSALPPTEEGGGLTVTFDRY